jgi:hypothetical protein
MRSAAWSFAFAFIAVVLWLVWNYEHEYTGIRAPWTGATYVASLCAFVAAGYFGRGLPALLIAAVAAVAAWVLVDPLVWHSSEGVPVPPTGGDGCDPGCISTEAAAIMAAVSAALLAAFGILLRRAASYAYRCL